MIINKIGDTFTYEGVTYTIGGDCETVFTTANSALPAGLIGKVMEIRTGSDQETGNEWPDFYCSFNPPQSAEMLDELNRRCGGVFGEDFDLDFVIMAPDELDVVTYTAGEKAKDFSWLTCGAKSFRDKFEAAAYADGHGWEFVRNDVTGEVLWIKGQGWVDTQAAA